MQNNHAARVISSKEFKLMVVQEFVKIYRHVPDESLTEEVMMPMRLHQQLELEEIAEPEGCFWGADSFLLRRERERDNAHMRV